MKYKIPLSKPVITHDMIEAAINALNNEKLVMGESVYKFEEEFAKYLGVKHAVAINSGTSALILAYKTINLGNGDKFIAPSATFISTISSAMLLGTRPIFTDINLDTYTIDTKHLEKQLNENNNVKAIVPVHLYGYPCRMDEIVELAEEGSIVVVEDCAQAHGARYKGRKVGTFGEVAIFSFYPIKNMTVGGDGGMLVTNNDEIAEETRKLRDCGRKGKYNHDTLGYVFRLNTVNAAIGLVQLKYLDKWNEKRRHLASIYDKHLSNIEGIITPPKPNGSIKPVYHLYVIRLRDKRMRDALGAYLEYNGIQALIHYPIPVHMQEAYKRYYGNNVVLKNTEIWADTVLSIPLYPELSEDEVKYIVEKIQLFIEKRLYLDKEWVRKGVEWYRKLI